VTGARPVDGSAGNRQHLNISSDVRISRAGLVDGERVAAARAGLAGNAETERLAEWFRVLGDPTRTRILCALLEAGELCVGDLAATVDATETAVSHALRWLRAAGMVRARRAGRMVYYALADGHVRLLLDVGLEHLRHGPERSR
jgi:ArsR family transcriptional regulator, lead/cadmium/zinc/bismuth-responsive transcriptional repressor